MNHHMNIPMNSSTFPHFQCLSPNFALKQKNHQRHLNLAPNSIWTFVYKFLCFENESCDLNENRRLIGYVICV